MSAEFDIRQPVESALRKLQEFVRRRALTERAVLVSAVQGAVEALEQDLRFEHLQRIEDHVWRFVAECVADGESDRAATFIEKHCRQPEELKCYLPVEFLTVMRETEFRGVSLLPTSDRRIPQADSWLRLEKPVGCVAVVRVEGTSLPLMAQRARVKAEHILRVLRVALRAHRGINSKQLRFRLGISYAFEPRGAGWSQREDVAYELGLDEALLDLARAQPASEMPAEPFTDMDRRADTALRWIERARFAGEPVVALLFLFFALEALLGKKNEQSKGCALAFRRAMLSHIAEGQFSDPNDIWFLYTQIRNGAVHGDGAPEVNRQLVDDFAGEVRTALSETLTLTHEQGITEQRALLKLLDDHPDRPQLTSWLRQRGVPAWTKYFDPPGRASKVA